MRASSVSYQNCLVSCAVKSQPFSLRAVTFTRLRPERSGVRFQGEARVLPLIQNIHINEEERLLSWGLSFRRSRPERSGVGFQGEARVLPLVQNIHINEEEQLLSWGLHVPQVTARTIRGWIPGRGKSPSSDPEHPYQRGRTAVSRGLHFPQVEARTIRG